MLSVLWGSKNLYKCLSNSVSQNLPSFFSLRRQLCTPWGGREERLTRTHPPPTPPSSLPSNLRPQKLYLTPQRGDTCLCLLRPEQQDAGRKARFPGPNACSGRFRLGHSGPGSLRSALLSTGDLCLKSHREKLIFVSCIRDKTNPTDLAPTCCWHIRCKLETAPSNCYGFVTEILISYLSHQAMMWFELRRKEKSGHAV